MPTSCTDRTARKLLTVRDSCNFISYKHDEGELTEAFLRVFRLERPATSLLRPRILWRVLRPELGTGRNQSTE